MQPADPIISEDVLDTSSALAKKVRAGLARLRKKNGRHALFENPDKPTVAELQALMDRPVKDALLYTAPLTAQDLKDNAGQHFLFQGANRAAKRAYARTLRKIRDTRGIPPRKRRELQGLTVEDRFRGSPTVLGAVRPQVPDACQVCKGEGAE